MEKVNDTDNKYTIGKEGWLFLDRDSNRNLEQITGKYETAANFDEQWRKLFEFRNERLGSLKDKSWLIIAPSKECVYPQYLPDEVVLSDRRPVFRVLQQAVGRHKVIYPIEKMRAASASIDVYPTGDTHWSLPGALIPYREFAAAAGLRPVWDDEIEFFVSERGDLSSKIGQKTKYIQGKIKQPKFTKIHDNEIANTGRKIIYENSDKSLPSCVMFRDSFGSILLDVLAQSFSRLVAVWQANMDWGLIEEERPDIVLTEMAERFIAAGAPNDVTGKSNADYVRDKTR